MRPRTPAGIVSEKMDSSRTDISGDAAFVFDRREVAGALADVGVLLPLMAGLILVCGLSAFTVFLLTGVVYLASGLYFRLPVPVQPLKAMAVIAIAGGAGADELAAAGIIMGVILLSTGITGLAAGLPRLFAPWTVKGVQLAVGLLLIKSSLAFVGIWGSVTWKGLDLPGLKGTAALLAALAALAALLLLRGNRKVPAALAVLVAGFALGLAVTGPALAGRLAIGDLTLPSFVLPGRESFMAALFLLVIPQLPLTFGNAVVATTDVAQTYFGRDRARRVTPGALCTSMGFANLVTGLLGGMPVCHGSGGMTAHYRFGARSGGAAIIMGVALMAMAVLLGDSAVYLILILPLPVLGALLFSVGAEHARLVLGLRENRTALSIAMIIGVVALLLGNIALGMAIGILVSLLVGTAGLIRRLLLSAAPAGRGGALVARLETITRFAHE